MWGGGGIALMWGVHPAAPGSFSGDTENKHGKSTSIRTAGPR